MTFWQDQALCKGQSRAFDFHAALILVQPDAYLSSAATCLVCPVRAECERWADSEVEANAVPGGGPEFIAAGYGYSGNKKRLLARACEACGAPVNAFRSDARYCSGPCRGRVVA